MTLEELLAQSEPITIPEIPGVKRYRNLMIPMRDGVRLAADLFLPSEAEPGERFPIVMEYIPYRKDLADLTARRFYLYLPQQGYIFVRVDIRGTGASEGAHKDEYLLEEQEDCRDTIEWLADRPFCDGQVNMIGISYGGFTALQVAAHAPPHLTGIIPVDFTDDRYQDECHYRGGLMRKYYNIACYGGKMIAANAMPPLMESNDRDPAGVWQRHLEENEPYLLKWYRHQTDGPYWRQGSVLYSADKIKCPVFMIGGWRDGYMNPPLRLFQALKSPRKVWIGPWNHAMPDAAVPGPRVEYLKEVVRWLDYWCKGKETGIMEEPPIVVYMQHSEPPAADRIDSKGHWRAETTWPPPGAREKVLYAGDNGLLDNQTGPNADSELTYHPAVGVEGGLFSGGLQFGLPGDQRPDEACSLVFTTPPLNEDLHILGRPKAELYVSSTAETIGFVVSLSDVAPDGSSHLVAKGALNATRRESFTEPSPLVPGEIYKLDIDIDSTGWVFEKGHRIRMAVANADWPNLWPTPEPAVSLVFRGPNHPTRLILPVVPATGSARPPEFSPSPIVKTKHGDSPNPPVWQVSRDMLSGRTTVNIQVNHSRRLTHGVVHESESSAEFKVDPRHPGNAAARGRHLDRLKTLAGTIEAVSQVMIQGAPTRFHIVIALEVHVDGTQHFAGQWTESVSRNYL